MNKRGFVQCNLRLVYQYANGNQKDAERISFAYNRYVKGWLNGNRSFVFRAQPGERSTQKTYLVTFDRLGTCKGKTWLGAELSLSEAQIAAMYLRQAIISDEHTVAQVKKVMSEMSAVTVQAETLQHAD